MVGAFLQKSLKMRPFVWSQSVWKEKVSNMECKQHKLIRYFIALFLHCHFWDRCALRNKKNLKPFELSFMGVER